MNCSHGVTNITFQIALHFNGRPEAFGRVIVINSMISGRWGKEVRFPWPELKPGQKMVIVVKVLTKGYTFEVQNYNHTFHSCVKFYQNLIIHVLDS